jgi:hypothetical protein
VRLGFGDGSQVDLDPTDPGAIALRAVADLLVQAQPRRADTHEGNQTKALVARGLGNS